jgi:L-lysine 2,3-aminomutase
MLADEHYERVKSLLENENSEGLKVAVAEIRADLNPHPAGQQTDNVPMVDGEVLPGAQHKYPQTVLFFPSQGQTCHAYCTFCFRWAQFVGDESLKFRSNDADLLIRYLAEHREVTDLLFTGGDPMVMKTAIFRRYIDAILADPRLDHIRTIRIGTKSVAYWPQRFVTDADADEMLATFEAIVASGRTVSVMGHYSHPVELSTDVARRAVSRIRSTGANIRMQSPAIRHVNDDAEVWRTMWQEGVRLGCIHVLGVQQVGSQKAFLLEYLQCRRPELVRQPFFAKFDPKAVWFDQLEPLTERDAEMFPSAWGEQRRFVPMTVHA